MAKKQVIILSHVLVAGKVKDIGDKVSLDEEDAHMLIAAGQAVDAKADDAAARVKGAKARFAAQQQAAQQQAAQQQAAQQQAAQTDGGTNG